MTRKNPLTTPLINENPIALNVLGVCSALAITNSLTNSLVMSAALTAVLVISNATISLLRHLLPSSVRLIVQITVIASAVTVIDQWFPIDAPENDKKTYVAQRIEYLLWDGSKEYRVRMKRTNNHPDGRTDWF